MPPKNTGARPRKPTKPAAARAKDAAAKVTHDSTQDKRATEQAEPYTVRLALETEETIGAIADAIDEGEVEIAAKSCFLGYATINLADRRDLGRGPILNIQQWNARDTKVSKIHEFQENLGEEFEFMQPLELQHAVILGVRRDAIDMSCLMQSWPTRGLASIEWMESAVGKEGKALLINGNHRRTMMEMCMAPVVDKLEKLDNLVKGSLDVKTKEHKQLLEVWKKTREQLESTGRWGAKVYDLDAIESHVSRDQIKLFLASNVKVWQAVDQAGDYLNMVLPLICELETPEQAAQFINKQSDKANTTRASRAGSNPTLLWHLSQYLNVPALRVWQPFSANFLHQRKDTPSPFLEALLFEGTCQLYFLCVDIKVISYRESSEEDILLFQKRISALFRHKFTKFGACLTILNKAFFDICEQVYMEHLAPLADRFGSLIPRNAKDWDMAFDIYRETLKADLGAWAKEMQEGEARGKKHESKLLSTFDRRLEWIFDGQLFERPSIGIHIATFPKPILVPAFIIQVGKDVLDAHIGYQWLFSLIEPLYGAILSEYNKGSGRVISTVLKSHHISYEAYNKALSLFLSHREAYIKPIHYTLKTLPKPTYPGELTKNAEDVELEGPLAKVILSVMESSDSTFPENPPRSHVSAVTKVPNGLLIVQLCRQTTHTIFNAQFEHGGQVVNSACKQRASNAILNSYKMMHRIWIPHLRESGGYGLAYRAYKALIAEPWLEEGMTNWYVLDEPKPDEVDKSSTNALVKRSEQFSRIDDLHTKVSKSIRGVIDAVTRDESTLISRGEEFNSEQRLQTEVHLATNNLISYSSWDQSSRRPFVPSTDISDSKIKAELEDLDVPSIPAVASKTDMTRFFAQQAKRKPFTASEVDVYERQKKTAIRRAEQHERAEEEFRLLVNSTSEGAIDETPGETGPAADRRPRPRPRPVWDKKNTTGEGVRHPRASREADVQVLDDGNQIPGPLVQEGNDKNNSETSVEKGTPSDQIDVDHTDLEEIADKLDSEDEFDKANEDGMVGIFEDDAFEEESLVEGVARNEAEPTEPVIHETGNEGGLKRSRGDDEADTGSDRPLKHIRNEDKPRPNLERKVPEPVFTHGTPQGEVLVPATQENMDAEEDVQVSPTYPMTQFQAGFDHDSGSDGE
ncbi:hypothetical protein BDZ94DRAFT_1371118 [Collybia nuda]|uniref:Uncharacterized protein n=1 Tax=Collybia nuda TaxID=64659 RepID=A0A9P6CI80_9AGAR|nr:hypothetical protein BDZ94DRAFT_1371118 [Collybia nuda]